MGKQIFPVLGLIAIGYGVLIYFAGRQAIRNVLNGADPTGLMAMSGGLIQFVLFGLILLFIIFGSVSLAKMLKIHKM